MNVQPVPAKRIWVNAFFAAVAALLIVLFLFSYAERIVPDLWHRFVEVPMQQAFDQAYQQCIAQNPGNTIGCVFTASIADFIEGLVLFIVYFFIIYFPLSLVASVILTFLTIPTQRLRNILLTVVASVPASICIVLLAVLIAKLLHL